MATYWALIRRELAAYSVSPIMYVLLTGFLFLVGMMFSGSMFFFNQNKMVASYIHTIDAMAYISVLFFAPLMTMRLMAEEKSRGTIETLMTVPVTDTQVVLAKYLAVTIVYVLMLIPTLFFVALMGQYTTIDPGEICGGYIALLLMAGAMFAIGLFISSLCANQISAAVVTLGVAFLLTFINKIVDHDPEARVEGFWGTVVGAIASALDYIHPPGRIANMARGIMESRDIVFFLTVIVLFLFLTVRSAESRRWR